MKTFLVLTVQHDQITVEAYTAKVEGGYLFFYDSDGDVVNGFSVGEWKRFSLCSADKPAKSVASA